MGLFRLLANGREVRIKNVIISVHYISNKILSHDSNYIVDVAMRPKFGNSSISVRKVIIISIL